MRPEGRTSVRPGAGIATTKARVSASIRKFTFGGPRPTPQNQISNNQLINLLSNQPDTKNPDRTRASVNPHAKQAEKPKATSEFPRQVMPANRPGKPEKAIKGSKAAQNVNELNEREWSQPAALESH